MTQPKWKGFFKVVDPAPEMMKMANNMSMDSSSYNNFSWYQQLVHGSSSRLSKYREYDQMDMDVDVARALDLVSEEMTNKNASTQLPLNLNMTTDLSVRIPSNVITTLRVALKQWCLQRGFETRLYQYARHMIKYGDVSFRRVNDEEHIVETWEYISPKHVMAAIVDKEDVTKILGWQVRKDAKVPKDNVGGAIPVNQEYETEIIPAEDIVRFTMNDDMSDEAPFGKSVLGDVYRVQKQKELLEDAIIIYRVQRAPERRVFYIDVGKMPPNRTKQYLETIKNEIRQKKVPSVNGGQSNVDSAYNPQSMSEDFYFASRPGGTGSKVETLPGGQNLGELTDLEYFRQKVLEGLRIPPSYLPNFQSQDSMNFNDGQVGVAYMQEIQFAKYTTRLASHLNSVLDYEFKRFLKKIEIGIDSTIFNISLPLPTNYEKYREAAVDGMLLSQFGNADGIEHISKRFALSRFLKLSNTELSTNETLLAQERGLNVKESRSIVQLYNPDLLDVDASDVGVGGSTGASPTGGEIGDMGDTDAPISSGVESDNGQPSPEQTKDDS